ncbi:MAG: IMP dehydrogenase [Gammaproteobacteria bacterium]
MRITGEALTFDDVLLVPAYSNLLPRDASLVTKLTREIDLNIPIISAAMDTVTEHRLAVSLAQEGGIGIIHKNLNISQQASEVRKVKKYESGVVDNPVTVTADTTIQEVLDLTNRYHISGMPVVDGDDLVGIVTSRDLRFETDLAKPVASIMTGKNKLVTVKEGASQEQAIEKLQKHRIEKVLVVNEDFHLRGLITVKDLRKADKYPNACKDGHDSLRVGAAVGTGEGTHERIEALVEAGVDAIVVDTAHGHSQGVLDMVTWAKKNHGQDVQIIGGNVATGAAATALVEAGADAVKVGIGPGSICTTRIVTGIGVPQITAINNVVQALDGTGVPMIADGGIRFSGDIAKALVAGAHSIMVGGLFAGTEEAPGDIELFQGRSYKSYRGMGSLGAMSQTHGSSDRYFQENDEIEKLVPEGIEGRVPYKGPLSAIIHQMLGGIRAAMGYTGCANMEEMRTKPEFVRVSPAGMRESHVHDVTITKEPPNYRQT